MKKNYAREAQKLKDKVKEQQTGKEPRKKRKKKQFVYSFKLADIGSRMYIGYGTSMKSEKEAYDSAMIMINRMDVHVESLRLDKYYSRQKYVKICNEQLGKVKMFLIPRKDSTIKGNWEWKRTMKRFVEDTKAYLKEYYKRNQSESCFGEDKKRTGWQLGQKREDRIDTADMLTLLWHNLYWLS